MTTSETVPTFKPLNSDSRDLTPAVRQISVVIITQDEVARLVRAIESCQSFADEIVVIDGGSQDNTVQWATELGCQVFVNPWPGFAKQRNLGISKASHDWVMLLDSDEVVSGELATAIAAWKTHPTLDANVFAMKRVNRFFDHWLNGQAEYMNRLYNKHLFPIKDVLVHEGPDAESAPVVQLSGILWHDSFRDIDDQVKRVHKYTTLEAQQAYLLGKRFNGVRLVLKPPARFVQRYFVQRLFLQGVAGFAYAMFWVYWDFLREIKLYEMDWQKRQPPVTPIPPDAEP